MRKRIKILFFCLLPLLLISGCSKPSAKVTVKSAKVVENLSTPLNVFLKSDLGTGNAQVGESRMLYTFPEREIIEVVLNSNFLDTAESLKAGSDDHRKEIYAVVRDSAAFTVKGEKVDEIWGYWPKKTTKNSATDMKLFYLIPEGTPLTDLKLTFDGTKLGDSSYTMTFTDFKNKDD